MHLRGLTWIITAFIIICPCLVSEASASSPGLIPDQVEKVETDAEEAQHLYGEKPKQGGRFVPIPIPISNPTIGTGLAVAGLYFHPKKEGDIEVPTTTTGVVGLYTDTESWAFGAFHDGFYKNDTFRIRAFTGYGEFNLQFYGIGEDLNLRDTPIDYKGTAFTLTPRVLFRLPADNWFVGLQNALTTIDTSFDFSSLLPDLPAINVYSKTVGFGLVGLHDSRDNNLWPSEGTFFETTVTNYGQHFGGDFDYTKGIVKLGQYFQLLDPLVVTYRLDGQFIGGNAPFYELSRINLRGFPQGRYIDKHAMTAQAEIRWNFYGRWTALAFGGGGQTASTISDLPSADIRTASGVGLRYMIAEEQKLNFGIDVTYGDDKVEVYFQVGDWLAN